MAKVRLGKVTQLRRPIRQRKGYPARQPFIVGHAYVLERVDSRHEDPCPECENGCDSCAYTGTVVTYEDRATTLHEHVVITGVSAQPLNWASEDDAKAEGYDSREELIAEWSARHPRLFDYYVVRFQLFADVPRFIARPDPDGRASRTFKGTKSAGHGDYAFTQALAIDDAEAVPEDYQRILSEAAKRTFGAVQRKGIEARLDECSNDGERLLLLKREAQSAGIDVRSELRVLERRLLRKIEQQRRAA